MVDEDGLFKISRMCKECKREIKSSDDQAYLDRFRLNCYQDFSNLLLKDQTGSKLFTLIEDMMRKYKLKNVVKNAEK